MGFKIFEVSRLSETVGRTEVHQKFLDLSVGIVIPTFNEERNIEYVLSQLNVLGYSNILVIDGSSSDNTVEVARQNGAKIVIQTGHGKGQAIRQVLQNDYLTADILILMDADGSMVPAEIPQFVKAICKGYDVAKGSRFLLGGGTYDMTQLRKFGNSVMLYITNLLHASNYTDICYGFAALNKKAVTILSQCLEADGFDIETEMFIKAQKFGLEVVEVPSIEYRRKHGESNLHSFRDGLKIFRKIFGLALS
ncbi:MAG: glycosyltransferase family 2 protein [Nitrososphaerota archaeon]|jgi:glycosyltransferase involved in cell wall biosynthesis|nr:glycosyltransferase family 2 protein [Nitrososphaerota archaeon]